MSSRSVFYIVTDVAFFCPLKVTVSEHDEATLRQMLEYIYTNRVKDMLGLSADEVIKLLALANGKSERASALAGQED